MKKLLVLLLISVLAIFVFAGCEGFGPPAEGEGEGEGEGEVEEVTVDIAGMQKLGGKNWVSKGAHDITVTFPTPMTNVSAAITACSGDYSSKTTTVGSSSVVLFPNEDKTVWTGSGFFGVDEECGSAPCGSDTDCCASYVQITSGECVDEVCIEFPVIVDGDLPFALIEVDLDDDACVCGGCALTFDSFTDPGECADTECCGDYCSGLAGWSIAIYDEDPFDVCCETPCAEPIFTCNGTECPIDCTTDCLDDTDTYYVVASLVDNVDNQARYYATVELDSACGITVTEYCADVQDCTCTSFEDTAITDTDEYIGFCAPNDNCCLVD